MYIGRFAPSPTGPLHIGSLLAAVISYLDAKANNGQWLLRIDDIDPPREQAGASDAIIKTLEQHGLHWDGNVFYQSDRFDAYQAAIEALLRDDLIYPCQCSRKQLNATQGIHPEQCIQPLDTNAPFAYRIKKGRYQFNDLYQGSQSGSDGHFVIKRRDQLFAYQLAATVDDHAQNISHVIRGYDLLDSTPKQLLLYQALNYQPPKFGHFPVITAANGQKLSKQNLAPAINNDQALTNLQLVMRYLNMTPPDTSSIEALLQWATLAWKTAAPKNLNQPEIGIITSE
ncbi:tRNA glutamyl-Q(34) synthetase GluQRS [Litoribacillus peritrichatus]|uniref:Glutamyl-Q tRNA(Asp) synthetase n=1 Tax=Litoribacillus peritrichatus TaxID=718191 RepID=A0ABP7MPF7_9GAMM